MGPGWEGITLPFGMTVGLVRKDARPGLECRKCFRIGLRCTGKAGVAG